jgi:MFS family permease
LGWGLGRLLAPADETGFWRAVVLAVFLGISLAVGLGLVDGLWSFAGRWNTQVGLKMLAGLIVGGIGGLFGGVVGQSLFTFGGMFSNALLLVGWSLTGLLVGASVGVFDVGARLMRGENLRSALRKVLNGTIGGAAGGLVGGVLYLALSEALSSILAGKEGLRSPSAVGFAALGMCVGFMVGLALVVLKRAWIKVESGFRPGRELILSKPYIKIGRAEECEVGLFGGAGVERVHAQITQQGPDHLLTDAGTPGGTFVNEKRIKAPTLLRSGDRIRVGNCVLLFQEKRRRSN